MFVVVGEAGLVGGAHREALAAIDEATPDGIVDSAALVAANTCSRPGAAAVGSCGKVPGGAET